MDSTPLSLLLIDDDDIEYELIQRSLRNSEVANDIYRARDGREGLEMLRGDSAVSVPKPVIVLLDLNLPRMNGFEFLDELRADPELKRTVVFVLTTSENERDKTAAHERFVCGYVVKSNAGSDFSRLIERIEEFWKKLEYT